MSDNFEVILILTGFMLSFLFGFIMGGKDDLF